MTPRAALTKHLLDGDDSFLTGNFDDDSVTTQEKPQSVQRSDVRSRPRRTTPHRRASTTTAVSPRRDLVATPRLPHR